MCNTLSSSPAGSPRCHPEPRLLLHVHPARLLPHGEASPDTRHNGSAAAPAAATPAAAQETAPAARCSVSCHQAQRLLLGHLLPPGATAPVANSVTCHPAQRHLPTRSSVLPHSAAGLPRAAAAPAARRSGSSRPAQPGQNSCSPPQRLLSPCCSCRQAPRAAPAAQLLPCGAAAPASWTSVSCRSAWAPAARSSGSCRPTHGLLSHGAVCPIVPSHRLQPQGTAARSAAWPTAHSSASAASAARRNGSCHSAEQLLPATLCSGSRLPPPCPTAPLPVVNVCCHSHRAAGPRSDAAGGRVLQPVHPAAPATRRAQSSVRAPSTWHDGGSCRSCTAALAARCSGPAARPMQRPLPPAWRSGLATHSSASCRPAQRLQPHDAAARSCCPEQRLLPPAAHSGSSRQSQLMSPDTSCTCSATHPRTHSPPPQ